MSSAAPTRSFFLAATNSESDAFKLLLSTAKALNLTESDLTSYTPMPAAEAYCAYLSQLSSFGGEAAVAAGMAVNFPTFGRMCGRVRDALMRPPHSLSLQDVGFFEAFAESTPGFDASAEAVIAAGMAQGETAESIRSGVEMLQGYERMFWNAVWAKATA